MKSERCRSTSLTAHHFFTLLNFVVLLIAAASLFCNMYLLRREIESVKTDVRPLLERHKEMSSRQSADIVFRSRNIRQLDEGGGGHGMMSVAPSPNDTRNSHGGMMTVAPGPDDGGGSHGGMTTVAPGPDGGGGGGHGGMTTSAPAPDEGGGGHGGMMTVAPRPDDGGGGHGGMMTVSPGPDGGGRGHEGITTLAPAPDEGGGGHGGMMTVAPGPDDGGGGHGLMTAATGSHNQGANADTEPPQAREQGSSTTELPGRETTTQEADQTTVTSPNTRLNQPITAKPTVGE